MPRPWPWSQKDGSQILLTLCGDILGLENRNRIAYGSGYNFTLGIGKSLRLSVTSTHFLSIEIAATMVSANVKVRPFRPHSYFNFPAIRPAAPVSSWHSSSPRNASVREPSPGRIPAYTSAIFRDVVERVWPARTSSARVSFLLFRRRNTSIKTEVSRSSFTAVVTRAFLSPSELGCAYRSCSATSLPTPQNHRASQGDRFPSMRALHFQENSAICAGAPLLAPFPPKMRSAGGAQQSCRFLESVLVVGGCEFSCVSYIDPYSVHS